MEIRPGINLWLSSITRSYKSADGTVQQKTYRAGDPEFDTYVAEERRKREEAEAALPKHFMLDAVGEDGTSASCMGNNLSKAFVQYYNGTLDQKGIESAIQDVVSNLRGAYVKKGFDEKEFMPKLLKDVYDYAKWFNIYGAQVKSSVEARKMAAYYNGDDRNSKDFIYYDSDLYYQSEEMKGTILEIMQRTAQKYGFPDVDFPEGYPDGNKRKSIYSSYNTCIFEHARNDFRVGNMLDETMAPPKGFRFFYKGNASGVNNYRGLPSSDGTPESDFDGVLHIQYGDWSFVGRVPVRQNPTQFPISVNMYDFVSKSRNDIPKEIIPAMKNFDFFAQTVSGIYCKSHPRNF